MLVRTVCLSVKFCRGMGKMNNEEIRILVHVGSLNGKINTDYETNG
jgi:hypothetical protein